MLSRKQFAARYNKIRPGLGIASSNLRIPEQTTKIKSSWFISVPVILPMTSWPEREGYWEWVGENCAGQVRCYVNNSFDEWWGFEKKSDIAFWMLKWA